MLLRPPLRPASRCCRLDLSPPALPLWRTWRRLHSGALTPKVFDVDLAPFVLVQLLPIGLMVVVTAAAATWFIAWQLGDIKVSQARVEERQVMEGKQLEQLVKQGQLHTQQLAKLEQLLKK